MKNLFDAFISYGRADSKAFAAQLNDRLTELGLNVWFDQDDIPPGVDWQNQIDDGIEKAHNFIFIIAPHSVKSTYCLKEIELAVKYNKRIAPVLHVNSDAFLDQIHPRIRKLNWIFFQEGINDFEASFASLMSLLRQHVDYVEQHTKFLVEALEWLRNQKQTNYLLIGDKRVQAESWLKIRFKDEQPPCIPTDLHCEFISESTKNANNLMTQVFISFSEKDRVIKDKISKKLLREGLTIWKNKTDRKTGTEFQDEINKGIEGADNFVYLMSSDSLASKYCQQELEHALVNKKRIIPLLIEDPGTQHIPYQLRRLKFIDFTQHQEQEKYQTSIDKLLNELNQDAPYYKQHKILLAKALKWQIQNHNPSLLLRGYNLQHYEAWLKVALSRNQHPPLPLQVEFIRESSRQPTESSLEVFISYSRADCDFAWKLNEALQELGKTTWFDQESIAAGSDFVQEIYRGIENSDNFLFIISPSSVNSSYCADEVEYALSLNKRFVTVLYKEVPSSELHPVLAKVQWIDFNKHGGDFYTNFSEVVRTLDTDREHVHYHTKWSQRALEWEQRDKSADLLLRGSELAMAEHWLLETEQQNKQPPATFLQKEFIFSSKKAILKAQEAEKRRQAQILRLQEERTKEAEARLALQQKSARLQKFFLAAVSTALVFAIGLGIETFRQYRQSALREIKAISKSSQALLALNQELDGLTKALKAWQKLQRLNLADADTQIQVRSVLKQAVYGVKEYNRLSGHHGSVLGVSFSPDGSMIVSGSVDNTVKLWKSDGTLLHTLKEHSGSVNAVVFSPDGKLIASGSVDNTVKLWKSDGTLLHTLRGHSNAVKAVDFSPDGKLIASGSQDKTIKLWKRDGTLLMTLKGHRDAVTAVNFSPDGSAIASGSDDKTIKLWKSDGTLLMTLKGHRDVVTAVDFSPDGSLIASGSRDKTIKLWKSDGKGRSYKNYKTLDGHSGSVWGVNFSPDGQRIASGSWDNTVKLWKSDGTLLMTLKGHRDHVKAVDFSPDGRRIASGSNDNTVKLWKPDSALVTTLFGHSGSVNAVDFSPDGQLIVSGSWDKTVKLWKPDGTLLMTLFGHINSVNAVDFSPDGQLIASGSRDKTVKLWKLDGTLLTTLKGHRDAVNAVDFSPDGQLIASGSLDKTIKLWQPDGKLLTTLKGHRDVVNAVVFSPDGQLIASGSGDNTIKLWQPDGKLLKTLFGHKSAVFAVDISPDGQMIVSGSADNTIKLWKIDGTLLMTIEEHSDSVLEVKFSSDGQRIASASADNTVKLWKLDGTLVTMLPGHRAAVDNVDFSPDGQTIASGSEDRTVMLWNLDSILDNKLVVDGCDWARDYLKHNSKVSKSDRTLCEGIESRLVISN
ncbi:MAG: TIR domain-containing protein [Xenococcaceae cyanobacterium]